MSLSDFEDFSGTDAAVAALPIDDFAGMEVSTPPPSPTSSSLSEFETETKPSHPQSQTKKNPGERDYISHSQISAYKRCPMITYWRYVKGIKTPPVAVLTFGSAIHKALEHNYGQKMYTKNDVPESVVLDVFRDYWRKASKETIFDANKDETPEYFEETGISMLKTYHADVAPTLMPKAVEARFMLKIPGVKKKVLGFIDLITEDESVIDHKTSKMVPNHMTLGKDLQLTLYKMAYRYKYGHDPKRLRYDYLVRKNSKKTGHWTEIHLVPVERNPSHEVTLIETYKTVTHAIKMAYFYPLESNFTCAPISCGFWSMCMGKIVEGKKLDFFDDIRNMQDEARQKALAEGFDA